MVILVFLSLILQFLIVLTNILGLPGSIISLILPFVWVLTPKLSALQFVFILLTVIAGEVAEFLLSIKIGKGDKIGGMSIITSVVFSFMFAILMAPLLFGFGAVIGSFIGAFLGTFIYEYLTTMDINASIRRGKSALKGRFLGTMVKIALGISSVILTGSYLL